MRTGTSLGLDADPLDDQNDCTVDTCTAGLPASNPAALGTACSSGGKLCDGTGICVECLKDTDCANTVCAPDHTCVPAQCDDGIENGGETDIDCGGPDCAPCAMPFPDNTTIPLTNTGASKTITFDSAGAYPYYCAFHVNSMQGVVFVE